MKKLTAYFSLFALLTLNSFFAQGGTNYLENRASLQNFTNASTSLAGGWILAKEVDKTITGSIYLFPSWIGRYKVTNNEGFSAKLFNLNYNILTNTLEVKIANDSVYQFDNKKINYVNYANKNYKFLENPDVNGMVLEIYKGNNLNLYKKTNLKVQEGSFNPMTQEKTERDKYIQVEVYYSDVKGKFEKIKLSKSAILNLVKDKDKKIKEFVKANKLDYSNEIDVAQILKHYESL